MLKVEEGKVIDGKVSVKLSPKLEHGKLDKVHALVMHQTGSGTAESTLNSYKNSSIGAHFLIDKDGTIYQTARVTRQCFHVGKIQSRCYVLHSCNGREKSAIETILKGKGTYASKVAAISKREGGKSYPERYPTNADSIGIEVVGEAVDDKYEKPTVEQNTAVHWLVVELVALFGLTTNDIYRHPQVSYKQESEAKNVSW